MKKIDVPDPDWKLLGELELAFSAHTESVISPWLEKILNPLSLPADLRTRILTSAQEAVARIVQSNSAVLGIGHIHLLILATHDLSTNGKTWSFFRIDKMDGTRHDHHPHDHSIEYYLYADV